MLITEDYLRQSLDKLLKLTREMWQWMSARQIEFDRDLSQWFQVFEREYASKLAAESEFVRKSKLKQEALSLLSQEQREALGV